MPLQATSGAASYDAFGGGVPAEPNYIESCFSTWLYTGNDSALTITNGIDLAGKGGLVWIKSRSAAGGQFFYDSARGATTGNAKSLASNTTDAQVTTNPNSMNFTSSGFQLTSNASSPGNLNASGVTAASWTFREQSKFFDVVTYTGNDSGQAIAHNLGSVPGCIIVKAITASGLSWAVYHRSLGSSAFLALNSTNASVSSTALWGGVDPTSTQFTVGTSGATNGSFSTYVAYIFAHNAGGFGLTGTDNVISCGSYTGNGSATGPVVTLGYEAQWFMVKRATGGTADWLIYDNMRGAGSNNTVKLQPNTSNAEDTMGEPIGFTATGFQPLGADSEINANGSTYIYIAIRRGPMKVPTTGTSVFTPYEVPGSPTTGAITGFVTDAGFIGQRAGADKFYWGARLMGNPTLNSTNANAESANTNQIWDRMNGWWNSAINGYMTWGFRRAPGYFDVVCYTGTGSARTINHNLTVAPELIIFKSRSLAGEHWGVWVPAFGFSSGILRLSTTDAVLPLSDRITGISATTVSVGTNGEINNSGSTYVMYLFASCPGVSKVFNFTGNGSSQTINCGFTAGARFVMIKRTDSTGDWYVWDTARGIVANNDPHLSLNTTAAEVTSNDTIDTDSTGFVVNQVSATNVNVNGASYIGLAIA